MMSRADTAADTLRSVEFDSPFTVTAAGELADAPAGIYAPEVYHDESTDITMSGAETTWEALTGYTGQHSYSGAVMHASEYLGGRLAADILETPGVYVVTSVEVLPEDVCRHCERSLEETAGGMWVDPEATGDDSVWRETCDQNDTREAYHERDDSPEPAGWAVLRLRHVSYPHEDGRLFDCPACEAVCHCTPDTAECVWTGHES